MQLPALTEENEPLPQGSEDLFCCIDMESVIGSSGRSPACSSIGLRRAPPLSVLDDATEGGYTTRVYYPA